MTFVKTALFHKAGEGSGGGGGGSDPHNLGFYADLTALQTAHPTGSDGDFAILGSTDTVWVWDSGTSAWKDTDTKGQVTSVNGQTGAVTVDTLPSQTGNAGKFLTTDGTDASWSDKPLVNTATGTDSLTILGTPSTSNLGSINIGSGSSTTGVGIAIGKNATGGAIAIGSGANCGGYSYLAIGRQANAGNAYGTAIGESSQATGNSAMAIGYGTQATASTSLAIGGAAKSTAAYAIQIGGVNMTNNEANTIKIGLGNSPTQNYKLLDSDGTIPSDRLIHAINKYSTMPTAGAGNLGWIVQFTGTTDSTYTHGHLYECVSDGGNPATYSWEEVQLGGGGSSYTAGTGIDITSGVISVTSPTLQNTATGTDSLTILGTATTKGYSINIGYNSRAGGEYSSSCLAVGNDSVSTGNYSVALGKASEATSSGAISIGYVAKANGEYSLAIGELATVSANNAIQINAALAARTNSDANTFKVGNANGNFEMMSADGTIPTARLTKVNTTVTLAAADWSSNTQTVSVTGMTATGVVMVSPDPTDQSAYTSAGILCTAQAAGSLSFTCDTVPSGDIDVNVVML